MNFIKPIIILLMLTVLVSCTTNSLEKTYEINSTQDNSNSTSSSVDISSINEHVTVSIPSVNNDQTIKQYNIKSIDIHYMAEKYFTQKAKGDVILFSDIANDIGVEVFRQNDAGTYYSVHKVEQGGLLYIFYATISQDDNYKPVIEWFYEQKNLSYKDFDSIKEGATIEDVEVIDPVTQIFENIYEADSDFWNDIAGGFESHHYLNDGVLYIAYEYKDGKISVSKKNFIEDYTIELFGGTSYYYDGSILPIDRIE